MQYTELKENKIGTYLIAFKNGKAGIYNNKKNIIKHEYEDIEYNAKNDLLIVQKASKQGVAKMDGTIIVPIEYNNILFAGSYINAKSENNVDIYNNLGNKEPNNEYVSKQDFAEGKYAIVSTADDEFKILHNNGKTIENQYTYAQYIFDKYFIIQKDGKFGIIDDDGNEIVKCKYTVIQPTLDYGIIQLLDKDGKIEIINTNFETIVKPEKIGITSTNGYLKVKSNEKETYINKRGEIVDISNINSNSMYPETIQNYKIVDLGYGSPYYVNQN